MPASQATPGPAITESTWFNAIWFQSTWFCAVLGRDSLLPLVGALLVLHLALVRNARQEAMLLGSIAFVGITVDALLSYAGVYQFANGVLVPLWLCGVWLAFATTLRRSLAYLGERPMLASLAGALALPFNYWAGQKLGAVEFGYPVALTLVVLLLIWAVMLPCLFKLSGGLATGAQGDNP